MVPWATIVNLAEFFWAAEEAATATQRGDSTGGDKGGRGGGGGGGGRGPSRYIGQQDQACEIS